MFCLCMLGEMVARKRKSIHYNNIEKSKFADILLVTGLYLDALLNPIIR